MSDYKNYPDTTLREPLIDWRNIPSLQQVVLEHFKSEVSSEEIVLVLEEVENGFRSVRNAAKLLGSTTDAVQLAMWNELRQ